MDQLVPPAVMQPDAALPKDSEPAATPKKKSRLSPLNQRRWDNFKRHRRGYWSLWIFSILFVITLFAELIANEPYLISYEGKYYYPFLKSYELSTFTKDDLDQGIIAEYHDAAFQKQIKDKGGFILWPPIRFHYTTRNLDIPSPAPSKPTWLYTEAECKATAEKRGGEGCASLDKNWLGTDNATRDVLARIIYGFRISVLFGLVLTLVSSVIGIAAGAVQGYFGGWTDLLFQRFIEIWTSVPTLYVLLIIAAVLPQGFFILLGILLLFSWTALVGVVRIEFLRARNFEYVRAARALGVSNRVLMFRHILPNAMVATLTSMPFILAGSVGTLTALDYLGFGLPPGYPSLGELLNQARSNLHAPWLAFTGFFTVAILLTLLIFIGEAVRDALDPRKTFT